LLEVIGFDGNRPVIDPNDAAMLLIDHQSGLFQTIGDMPRPELRLRAAALANMATLCKMPVITTASVPQGPNGPLIPEIHENAPHAPERNVGALSSGGDWARNRPTFSDRRSA
jgi:nicotinamidase-related amidase